MKSTKEIQENCQYPTIIFFFFAVAEYSVIEEETVGRSCFFCCVLLYSVIEEETVDRSGLYDSNS